MSCMEHATDHLTGTDHTQRFDLGSARSGGRAEAAGHHGAITADRAKGRGEHDCD